jgi:hypothetical protein
MTNGRSTTAALLSEKRDHPVCKRCAERLRPGEWPARIGDNQQQRTGRPQYPERERQAFGHNRGKGGGPARMLDW